MEVEAGQLKKFIIDAGLVTEAEFVAAEKAAATRGRKIGDILISDGHVSEDEFRRIEAYVLGIPFVSLKNQKIPFDILSLIPEPIARNHNIVAYDKDGKNLEVAMLDPEDLGAIDFIKKTVNLKILPRLTDTDSVRSALLQYQKSLKDEFGDIIKREVASLKPSPSEADSAAAKAQRAGQKEEAGLPTGQAGTESESELKKLAEDLPIIRIVDTLIRHAILQKASDIHIEPGDGDVVIRYRIDGILHDAMVLPKKVSSGLSARVKVLASLRLDEKRLPQDGRFDVGEGDERVSLRVSVMPTFYGEKIALRLLPDTVKGFTLEGLGLHGDALERVHEATRKTTGMILVTGPTGSGKTTTLYTILSILNKPSVNIATIEDPIEYQIPRINQTQVKPDIGLTFANGLRSLVRQDPDIVMVGEIRDKETVGLAINAALTGHLVLSTLHTNSASAAVPRLLDMGGEPFLLASTVNVILGQRLVRRLCEAREKYLLTDTEIRTLKKHIDADRVLTKMREEKAVGLKDDWTTIPFYRPKPSAGCEDGYKGRIGIYEVLIVSSALRELIMKGASDGEMREAARREGMTTMIEDGIILACRGITTIEEVLRVANE